MESGNIIPFLYYFLISASAEQKVYVQRFCKSTVCFLQGIPASPPPHLPAPHSLRDPSSLTRDRTQAPGIGSSLRVLITGPSGSSPGIPTFTSQIEKYMLSFLKIRIGKISKGQCISELDQYHYSVILLSSIKTSQLDTLFKDFTLKEMMSVL